MIKFLVSLGNSLKVQEGVVPPSEEINSMGSRSHLLFQERIDLKKWELSDFSELLELFERIALINFLDLSKMGP